MMTAYYGKSGGNGSPMPGNSSNGSYGWMTSDAGYRWMTGGAGSPGWMTGALPSAMMGSGMMGTRYVYEALAAGASGFLLKDVTPAHLAAAIRLVATGDALLAPSITRRLVEKFASAGHGPHTASPAIHRDLTGLTPGSWRC